MAIHESGEMYLEAILVLKKEAPVVRAIDIVNHTGYSKPSVSRALSILKKNEYVIVDENGYISFTPKGEKHAITVYERHQALTALLKKIGVSQEAAEEDACKMEHVISDETFRAIQEFLKK